MEFQNHHMDLYGKNMTTIDRMRKLINNLPESDIQLGERFINERQFISLQELVDSAIFKVNKNIRGDKPKAEYLKVDLWELKKLKAEVDVYVEQLQLPSEEEYEEY